MRGEELSEEGAAGEKSYPENRSVRRDWIKTF
jgi:hypothetical protein